MKALLTVGHPHSGLESIKEILLQTGMKTPLLSLSHNITTLEITDKILKSEDISLTKSSLVYQIKPGKVWDEFALNLLLANIDEDFWGWSDIGSIFLLNYWGNIIPKLKYILVYDSPENMLTSEFDSENLNQDKLERSIIEWQNYNEEMNIFYSSNKNKCLLVHAGQVNKHKNKFIDLLSSHIDLPLINHNLELKDKSSYTEKIKPILAKRILNDHPKLHKTYKDLQKISDISFIKDNQSLDSKFLIWNSFHIQNPVSEKHKTKHNNTNSNEIDLLSLQFIQLQKELEFYYIENQHISKISMSTEQEHIHRLHQSQEDLERIYLEKAELQSSNKIYKIQLKQLREELNYNYNKTQNNLNRSDVYGAADRIKSHLSYRLGTTMLDKSKNFKGWLSMPWSLIQVSKEFKNEKNLRETNNLLPISEYKDAEEAEKTKQHLSYRLGKTMLANYKSPIGWIKLPWALKQEISDFNSNGKGS